MSIAIDTFYVLHNKLLFDLVPAYTKNLHNCKDLADIRATTRVAFTEVMRAVFPDEIVVTKSKLPDPQEARKGERYGDLDLLAEVTIACKEFAEDQKAFEVQCDEEVIILANSKASLL